jgi:predicted aspartyl protease
LTPCRTPASLAALCGFLSKAGGPMNHRMRRTIPLATLMIALTNGCAAQTSNRPLAEVPFTLYQNGIIVPAVVNGRDPVRLLLDTGWGPLALVSASAQRLGLQVVAPDVEGLGRTHLGSLAIGGVVQRRPLVEIFPTEALAPLIGPHDGILSTAFFRDLVLQVDYPAQVVRFWQRSPIPRTPSATGSRVSVPMVFSSRAGGLPFTDSVFVDGRPVRGLFDTGGAGAFVATRQLVERAGLRPVPDSVRAFVGLLSADTTARQAVQFTRVGRVALGPFAVDSARVMIAPPLMGGDDWGHDLIIGYGFMRHYVVTFDYPGRIVTFERPSVRTP